MFGHWAAVGDLPVHEVAVLRNHLEMADEVQSCDSVVKESAACLPAQTTEAENPHFGGAITKPVVRSPRCSLVVAELKTLNTDLISC